MQKEHKKKWMDRKLWEELLRSILQKRVLKDSQREKQQKQLQQLKKRRDALQRSAQRRAVYGDTVRRLKASVVQLYHAMIANTPVLVKGFILVFLGLSGGRALRA